MSINEATKLLKAISKELPIHKGNLRVWIASDKLHESEMINTLSYNYTINKRKKQLIIKTDKNDNRKITVRKSSNLPIIDINNSEITDLYKNINMITIKIYNTKIVIEPLKEVLEQQKAKKKLKTKEVTFIDIFAGSGTLSEALKNVGMKPIFATELEDKYLTNYEKNNKNTLTYNTDITNIDWSLVPKRATGIAIGVPCECFTPSGIVKKQSLGQKSKEQGNTGFLGYFLLEAVEKIRPAFIILEEVLGFRKSVMMDIIRSVLKVRGYKLTEKILHAEQYGGMTKRKRFCMVATISDKPFKFSNQISFNMKSVKDILEVSIKDRVWLNKDNSKSIAYSLKKEQKHIKKGEGFRIARTYLDDAVTATITKGYFRNQLTNPILVHPKDENRFSWFTPRELARLNGLPDSFILPEAKTNAGELIGQGVSQEPFMQVARDILEHLKNAA